VSPIDERLKSLDIVLPDVMPPIVDGYVPAFAPFIRSGDQIHLSGRLGKEGGKLLSSIATISRASSLERCNLSGAAAGEREGSPRERVPREPEGAKCVPFRETMRLCACCC
jgi:hypothetical protein